MFATAKTALFRGDCFTLTTQRGRLTTERRSQLVEFALEQPPQHFFAGGEVVLERSSGFRFTATGIREHVARAFLYQLFEIFHHQASLRSPSVCAARARG